MKTSVEQAVQLDEAGISLLAYEMWQNAGCPAGQDMKFWLEAEAQLRVMASKPAPPAVTAPAPQTTPVSTAAPKSPVSSVQKPAPPAQIRPQIGASKADLRTRRG